MVFNEMTVTGFLFVVVVVVVVVAVVAVVETSMYFFLVVRSAQTGQVAVLPCRVRQANDRSVSAKKTFALLICLFFFFLEKKR